VVPGATKPFLSEVLNAAWSGLLGQFMLGRSAPIAALEAMLT